MAGCNYGGTTAAGDEPAADDALTPERMVIERVVSYAPAPGQYINIMPRYEESFGEREMADASLDYLNRGWAVSLGAFGGSITLELATPIQRQPSRTEFFIGGNAISNSSEPGIVEVSADGETWYTLKGEIDPAREETTTVTYTRIADSNDIAFATQDEEGLLPWLPQYNAQSYWPKWIAADAITLTATRLPGNASLNTSTGKYEFTPYRGYADSYPNNSTLGYLDLDDATDPDTGEPAEVNSVKFIRITTAILQINGILGESSTEVSGVYILR